MKKNDIHIHVQPQNNRSGTNVQPEFAGPEKEDQKIVAKCRTEFGSPVDGNGKLDDHAGPN